MKRKFKIWEINHRLKILLEVSELKLNEMNNQITSIRTSLLSVIPPDYIKLIPISRGSVRIRRSAK